MTRGEVDRQWAYQFFVHRLCMRPTGYMISDLEALLAQAREDERNRLAALKTSKEQGT